MADEQDQADQDKMAAEWAAAAGGGSTEGDAAAAPAEGAAGGDGATADEDIAGPTRVLNQNEIDSLLGFGEDDGGGSERSGIRAIVDSALVSYERLPMLEVVFDRLVRMMSTSLRNFTSDNVEVSIDNITSIRFGDYLNSIPLPAMLTVFRAEQWDNYGLLTIDSALIYSIVDVLLGGRRGTAAMRIEGRPYTTIERNLVERLVSVVLSDLSGAFDPLTPVTFRFERLETNPRFATIGRPANAAVLARLRVDMEDRGGRLEVLLPYATLEPVREILLQGFLGEKFGRDAIWEAHLAGQLWNTKVPIQAVLDTVEMPLRDVLNLEVGTRIPLTVGMDADIRLICGDLPMFIGKMGRKSGNIAIQVQERIDRERGNT
jgi:flagellar motor switch protein FliM